MPASPWPRRSSNKAAALIIVLAFVVLLTGLALAFFSRTTTERQLTRSSYNDTSADLLASTALDSIVSDLQQEISNGSTLATTPTCSPSPTSSPAVFIPNSNAYMVPVRNGTPGPGATPIPNLIRRSMYPDLMPAPGIASRASNVGSTTVSANGRSITSARWNGHYLIPRLNAGSTNIDTAPVSSFTAPDWVIITRGGPTPFASWTSALA